MSPSPSAMPQVSAAQMTSGMGSGYGKEVIVEKDVVVVEKEGHYGMGGAVGALIVWFFIIFIAAWFLLFALKPTVVNKKDCDEVDTGKVLLAAAIIALVIIIIIWVIKCCTSRRY